MKAVIKYAPLLLLGILQFISYRKEYSCEDCADNNKTPIAAAGPDQTIILPTDRILLDGSNSNDQDGKINAWLWAKVSGPASFTIMQTDSAKTSVKDLTRGVYQFELKIIDDKGASSKDTVMITVDAVFSTNHPPVACAGVDQVITLPTNAVTLNGTCSTDPDNNIVTYLSTKISGPSSFAITNPNALQTQVSSLVQGIYQFNLNVTDAGGLFSNDTVQIKVDPQSIVCDNSTRPQVNAQLIPVGTLSQARSSIAAASSGNKIVFAGGFAGAALEYLVNNTDTVKG